MYLARIYVTLKAAVNDPQGQTVLTNVNRLGFLSIDDIRIGKYLEIRVNETDHNHAQELIIKLCDKLLANPVIEEYRFELQEISTVQGS